jgi:hypothetical protein
MMKAVHPKLVELAALSECWRPGMPSRRGTER